MKLALINGSPKAKNSASETALKMVKKLVEGNHSISEYNFRTPQLDSVSMEEIAECDAVVFAFPLYVDGIPSHMLNCLYQMEDFFKANPRPDIRVYALVNSGFYDAHQNSLALEMVENWCVKSGIVWGQGIGIGGGGMLPSIVNVPDGKGPKKKISEALNKLADNISNRSSKGNILVSPAFPRFAYKLMAEAGWRQSIYKNGLRRKDLSLRK